MNRKTAVEIGVLWLVTVVILYAKMTPQWLPMSWGEHFGHCAWSLEVVHPSVATRWVTPWIAHYTGFGTPGRWLVFLLVFFLIGLTLLYRAARQAGGTWAWAGLIALVPVASTTGWYSVYLPGYPDWFMFTGLVVAAFARRWWIALAAAILAMLSHERAVFVVVLLPAFRVLLHPPIVWKLLIRDGVVTAGIVGLFLAFKDPLLGIGGAEYTTAFYLRDLQQGHSIIAPERLTWIHLQRAFFESHKALLIVAAACIAVLAIRRSPVRGLALVTIVGGLLLIPVQLLVAADSVRLLDLLVFPILLALLLAHRVAPGLRTPLTVVLGLALFINQLAPVVYRAQNWTYMPDSPINSLWYPDGRQFDPNPNR